VAFTKRSRLSPIGLDIGDRCVRAAQLRFDRRERSSGTTTSIAALARLARPHGVSSDELNPRHLSDMFHTLERQGFAGDDYVIAVPQRQLLSGVLEVPPRTSGAPIDVICRNELARTHRLEPDQIEAAWWELPPPPVGTRGETECAQALAVGCRTTDAEHWVEAFRDAGANICAIDARGPALARAVAARALDAPALTAVLEWSWESALIVVARAGMIVYERHLPESGLAAAHAEMGRKLSIDADAAAHIIEQVGLGEAAGELAEEPELIGQAQRIIGEQIDSLVLEIRASTAYAGRRLGNEVGRLIVCGDGASVPEAMPRLGRRVEMPTELADPASLFESSPPMPTVQRAPSLAAALGLAAHPQEDRP